MVVWFFETNWLSCITKAESSYYFNVENITGVVWGSALATRRYHNYHLVDIPIAVVHTKWNNFHSSSHGKYFTMVNGR